MMMALPEDPHQDENPTTKQVWYRRIGARLILKGSQLRNKTKTLAKACISRAESKRSFRVLTLLLGIFTFFVYFLTLVTLALQSGTQEKNLKLQAENISISRRIEILNIIYKEECLPKFTDTPDPAVSAQSRAQCKPFFSERLREDAILHFIRLNSDTFSENEPTPDNLLAAPYENRDLQAESPSSLTCYHYPRSKLLELDLTRANLDNLDFTDADLSKILLFGASIKGTTLTNTDLSHANLQDATFAPRSIDGLNLSSAVLNCITSINIDFRKAFSLKGTQFEKATLKKANFSGKDLTDVNFLNAHLAEANFSGAKLDRTNFSHAILRGAIFFQPGDDKALPFSFNTIDHIATADEANFKGAVLAGADLRGIDLSTVKNLSTRQLVNARGDSRTKLPPGLERPAGWPPFLHP